MELFSNEVKDMKELAQILQDKKEVPKEYKVAVIVFVFDKDNKIILQRRGPACRDERFKLEGIGGGVKLTDSNFRSALHREITEEVGENAYISIDTFITAIGEKTLDLRDNKEKYWILLAYKGTLQGGELEVAEPDKNLGYERYDLNNIEENELSIAAKKFYQIMKENRKHIF